MPSMSYCVFENTAADLPQCIEKLETGAAGDWSECEQQAALSVVRLAHVIAARWDEDDTTVMLVNGYSEEEE